MPGMLMSDRITISCGSISPVKLLERLLARESEMQHIGTLAGLAAKALAEQVGDIGLVIDDQNADGHGLPLAAARFVAYLACGCRRGRRTVNSVNSPTWLSTVIVPPCCCVTMS